MTSEVKKIDQLDQFELYVTEAKIRQLKNWLAAPPKISLHGFWEVKSNFEDNWQEHVYHILLINNISPVWILDILSEEPDRLAPTKVTIQCISHYVKNQISVILNNYIIKNNLKQMIVT
jgi:hypothetical protein